jgi:hypothetical protein
MRIATDSDIPRSCLSPRFRGFRGIDSANVAQLGRSAIPAFTIPAANILILLAAVRFFENPSFSCLTILVSRPYKAAIDGVAADFERRALTRLHMSLWWFGWLGSRFDGASPEIWVEAFELML